MIHSTYPHKARRADSNAVGFLLRDVFSATPLAIFIDALNGRTALPRSSRR